MVLPLQVFAYLNIDATALKALSLLPVVEGFAKMTLRDITLVYLSMVRSAPLRCQSTRLRRRTGTYPPDTVARTSVCDRSLLCLGVMAIAVTERCGRAGSLEIHAKLDRQRAAVSHNVERKQHQSLRMW